MGTKIKIFTLSTCGHCKETKKFLNDHNVEFDFIDVDLLTGEYRQEVIDEVRELNPRLSFPTIIIGEKVIIGFREEELKEELDL
ncbi:MAG TPA: glutaredoxin family protein [Deltaproteobacteria bacterium]|nr:glutaredoxin family protein [Deltaproteobacteria bacterium]